MSDLDQLRASANTTQETINQAAEQVRAAYATACDLHHQLATLGLDGVAATVEQAQATLETATHSVASAVAASDAVTVGLSEITEQTDRPHTLTRLTEVIDQLNQAGHHLDTARTFLSDSYAYAVHADVGDLTALISTAHQTVSDARQTVDDTATKTDTYRQRVEELTPESAVSAKN